MIILGLHGPAGIGKSSIAKYIANPSTTVKIGDRLHQFRHIVIKEPILQILAVVYGKDPASLDDPATKEKFDPELGMSSRLAQIKLGKALRDSFGPDILCRIALRKMHALKQLNSTYAPCFVVESIRFENEVKFFKERAKNQLDAKVVMAKVKGKGVKLESNVKGQVTEQSLADDLFDIIIENDFSKGIPDLADEILEEV